VLSKPRTSGDRGGADLMVHVVFKLLNQRLLVKLVRFRTARLASSLAWLIWAERPCLAAIVEILEVPRTRRMKNESTSLTCYVFLDSVPTKTHEHQEASNSKTSERILLPVFGKNWNARIGKLVCTSADLYNKWFLSPVVHDTADPINGWTEICLQKYGHLQMNTVQGMNIKHQHGIPVSHW
jgi:hypothetical protein